MTIVKFCIRHGDLKLEDVYINKKNLQKYCKECAKISKRKTNAKLKEKNKELIEQKRIENRRCMIDGCNNLRNRGYRNPGKCSQHIYSWDYHKTHVLIKKEEIKLPEGIGMFCIKHGEVPNEFVYFKKDENGNKIKPNYCKLCSKDRREKNPELRNLNAKLKRYNLQLENYEKMINEQKNLCKICNKPETKIQKGKIADLSVDHCHDWEKLGIMKVRGLLCAKCNSALAMLKDDPDLFEKAAKYLRSNTKP